MKGLNKAPNLENFTNFYEKLVDRESDAQYVRKQIEDLNRPPIDSRASGGRNRRPKNGEQPPNLTLLGTDVAEKPTNAEQGHKTPVKGKYTKAWCIFENCFGHSSSYCLNAKLDFPQKLAIAKKENVCLVCLKVANHKGKDCDAKFKTCLICGQNHNTNLHARREVDEAFRKRKRESKSD